MTFFPRVYHGIDSALSPLAYEHKLLGSGKKLAFGNTEISRPFLLQYEMDGTKRNQCDSFVVIQAKWFIISHLNWKESIPNA